MPIFILDVFADTAGTETVYLETYSKKYIFCDFIFRV